MNAPVRLTVEPKSKHDFIVRTLAGIIRQNGFGFGRNACRYRTEEGKACAIGLWMPDSASPELLNFQGGVYALNIQANMCGLSKELGLARKVYDSWPVVAGELQGIHDKAAWDYRDLPVVEALRSAVSCVSANRKDYPPITNEHIDEAAKLAASEEVL